MLKSQKFTPKVQNLLLSPGFNSFPYNIYLDFPSKQESDSNKTYLFIFKQEEFSQNKEIIFNFLENLRKITCVYNITVLFSYGDSIFANNIDTEFYNLFGSEIFLELLNQGQSIHTIIYDFSSSKNSLITYGNGKNSPSYMIQSLFNSAKHSGLKFILPFYYLSQIYTYDISVDKLLESFLNKEIPAAKICLQSTPENQTQISDFLINSSTNLLSIDKNYFDQHFLIFRVPPKRYVTISENAIVISVILIIFGFLLFLFIYFFIIHKNHFDEWKKFQNIWYALPLCFVLVYLSLFLGKHFSLLFIKELNELSKTIITSTIQFTFSIILSFVFYSLTFTLNKSFSSKAIDFLIIFGTFINQFIFLLLDVSFFPLFMLICIGAIISLFIKNKYAKTVLLLILVTPLAIYINSIILSILTLPNYYNFLFNYFGFIFMALAIYPTYLFVFRCLSSFCNGKNTKTIFIINGSCAAFLLILSTSFFLWSLSKSKKLLQPEKTQIMIAEKSVSDQLKISYKDKKVLENKIRTLNISLPENTVLCDIIIHSNSGNPVLYSDNSFETIDVNSSRFLVPQNPGKYLTFSYGFSDKNSKVQIINYIETGKNQFYRIEKSVIIE